MVSKRTMSSSYSSQRSPRRSAQTRSDNSYRDMPARSGVRRSGYSSASSSAQSRTHMQPRPSVTTYLGPMPAKKSVSRKSASGKGSQRRSAERRVADTRVVAPKNPADVSARYSRYAGAYAGDRGSSRTQRKLRIEEPIQAHSSYSAAEDNEAQVSSEKELDFAHKIAAKRSLNKKKRTKQNAERMYNRSYGKEDAQKASAASDGGASPRAAVTKAEMGKNHKHTLKLQLDGAQQVASGIKKASTGFVWTQGRTIVACAMLCMVLFGVFLYPATKDYYCAVREQARLEVEYNLLTEQNNELQKEVDSLKTDQGVEDEARLKYSWIKNGEQTANVSGISTIESNDGVYNSVLSGEISAPETWYSGILDPLFGVQ